MGRALAIAVPAWALSAAAVALGLTAWRGQSIAALVNAVAATLAVIGAQVVIAAWRTKHDPDVVGDADLVGRASPQPPREVPTPTVIASDARERRQV
jgi:hypothetical protein